MWNLWFHDIASSYDVFSQLERCGCYVTSNHQSLKEPLSDSFASFFTRLPFSC